MLVLLVILMILSLYIFAQVVKDCLKRGKMNRKSVTAIISTLVILVSSGFLFYIN